MVMMGKGLPAWSHHEHQSAEHAAAEPVSEGGQEVHFRGRGAGGIVGMRMAQEHPKERGQAA